MNRSCCGWSCGDGPWTQAGTDATPAAFYLGLCRLRGILSLPAPHDCAAGGPFSFAATKIRIGRGRLLLCDGCGRGRCHDCAAGGPFSTATTIALHRFPSLGLKLRIDARKRMFPGKSLHRFTSLSLKSRIDAATRTAGETILLCSYEN